MIEAIMGMIAVLLAMVGVTLGVTLGVNKTVQRIAKDVDDIHHRLDKRAS